jgi:hypothetical protein
MARRNGIPTLLSLAQRMCFLVTKFTPIIQAQFPSNAALLAALAAANSACAVLVQEAGAVREFGD